MMQANLYDLYKEIFLSPHLLAENVENDLKQHIPEDPRDDPETKAAGHLVDVSWVLSGARLCGLECVPAA